MISMKVVKRNGTTEEVSFDKVLTRIQLAAKGLEVNPTLIAQRTLLRIYDGRRPRNWMNWPHNFPFHS